MTGLSTDTAGMWYPWFYCGDEGAVRRHQECTENELCLCKLFKIDQRDQTRLLVVCKLCAMLYNILSAINVLVLPDFNTFNFILPMLIMLLLLANIGKCFREISAAIIRKE